jgi:virginiamycin B lyase
VDFRRFRQSLVPTTYRAGRPSLWLAASAILSLLLGLAVSAKPALAATISEFAIPTGNSEPAGIAAGPDGALWFTEENEFANKIGRVTTSGSFTEFPIPTPSSDPVEIALGPDSALWFTEANANKIGRITTGGSVSEFTLPTAQINPCPTSSFVPGAPFAIAAGPDGALWFTEVCDNKIGRITTTGSVSLFAIPSAISDPSGIAAGPDGALWFTENTASSCQGCLSAGNTIGRITTSGSISEFTTPTANSGPFGIGAGPDGALWFTENNANKIGRISTTGSISEFPVPTANSGATEIRAGPDGALWFTEIFANQIGRISITGSISEFPVPTPNSGPFEIAVGPDLSLWFTEEFAGKIGRITALPTTPGGLSMVVGQLLTAGCIDNSGIANALIAKLSAAQAAIAAGDIKTATNILSAFIDQVSAQSGKHILTSCGGLTVNPAAVLIADAQSLINGLTVSATSNPVTGSAVTSTGSAVAGAMLSLVNSSGTTEATATTDITGFYYFATTGLLTSGATYSVSVTELPTGFTTASPAVQTLTWSGGALTLSNFTLS